MSKSTTIVTTTTALSAIADKIRDEAQSRGQIPSKQRLLNSFAQAIAGPKHDWGYLTGAQSAVIQKDIPDQRLADLAGLSAPSRQNRPELLSHDPDLPAVIVKSRSAALFSPEMARYLASQLTGDLLSISEDLTTDGCSNEAVDCMFMPRAHFASQNEIDPTLLWGGNPDLIDRAARAYFATVSNSDLTTWINTQIEDWPDDPQTTDFMAYYFPHALIIATEDPFYTLRQNAYDPSDETQDGIGNSVDSALQVYIDETLDAPARTAVCAEVESFLIRLAHFLNQFSKPYTNISVI